MNLESGNRAHQRGVGKREPLGSIHVNEGEMMESEIIELTQSEVDEVSGSGIMYWLGYGLGVATFSAAEFYAELPAGYALL